MDLVVEKVKQLPMAIQSLGGGFFSWLDRVFPRETRAEQLHKWVSNLQIVVVENLKPLLMALQSFRGEFFSWLERVFPPETRAELLHKWVPIGIPILVAAALFLTICYCYNRGGGGGGGRAGRMMKAPGRDLRILRSKFESNPKSYFQNLRGT